MFIFWVIAALVGVSKVLRSMYEQRGIRLNDIHENNVGVWERYDQLIIFDANAIFGDDINEFPDEIEEV